MAFTSAKELLDICERDGKRISQVMLDSETERGKQDGAEIRSQMQKTLEIMRASYQEPLLHSVDCIGGLIGGEGRRLVARLERGEALLGSLLTRALAYAMSVMEQNSAMGCVVAAPTAGSAGVLPGVLFAMQEELGLSDDALVDGLFCSGAIGYLYMRNASVAGAEAGCQAEIGAASAMCAAMIVELCGGTPRQALDASAMSIGNLLGLVCDPVAGLVQCPCQARNAIGVTNAFTCAEIILSGTKAIIPFDEMLDVMYRVGVDIPAALRETALGGCAATPTGKAIRSRIFGADKPSDTKQG